jgi:teneurin
VNSSKVIVVQYDPQNNKETYLDKDHQLLLSVSYDKAGQPVSWDPMEHGSPFHISYDRFNRLEGWTWGDQAEKYLYDRHGLLSELITGEKDSTQFTYNELRMVRGRINKLGQNITESFVS